MREVIFKTKNLVFKGRLNHSQAAVEIFSRLPLSSNLSCWGKEIYFDLGFKVSSQGATMEVALGDIAYWPQGKSLCVFYGPTPLSEEENIPVPASPVVIVGKAQVEPGLLDEIKLGSWITLEKTDNY